MSIESAKSSRGSRVSVCLLVYNDVASLPKTVNSILAQTLPDFEFIISDDGSTDGTWEAVVDLTRTHPNIRAIQTPTNMKMCGNANHAVSHATREYIALLHHGDVYREDLLEKWSDVMARHDSVGFVFNEFITTRMRKSKLRTELEHKSKGQHFSEWMPGRQFLEKQLLSRWSCCVWGTTMIRKSCWDSVGGMREEFGLMADVDLWMRLAARWDVGYVDAPLFTLQHLSQRPEYYASEYRRFWLLRKLAYSIHASNLVQYYANSRLRYWWKWLQFRMRVSMETCKWLTYAVVRKRSDMICQSIEAECPWEFAPVRWYRNCVVWATRQGPTMQAHPGTPNGGVRLK